MQAYRRQALLKHPDKQKNNPNAGAMVPLPSSSEPCAAARKAVGSASRLMAVRGVQVHHPRVLPTAPPLTHAPLPSAAAEFDALKKAYAVLTDADARGALDEYIK